MTEMLARLLPLYSIVVLGFLAGKKLGVTKESFAPLLIYILSPSVVFFAALSATIDARIFYLPFITFGVGTLVCFACYYIARISFSGTLPNLLGFASGDANSGYFGIPVAISLFGEKYLAPYVMAVFGLMIYENTVGYYVTARGNFSRMIALRRLSRIPTVYAFFFGLTLNVLSVQPNGAWRDIGLSLRGAYSTLGMMIIGLGIASLARWEFDWKANLFLTVSKFILWPALMLIVLLIDASMLGIIAPELRPILFFFSSLPLAANTVTFATELQVEPARAAVAVLVSALLATILIPASAAFYRSIAPLLGL